MKTLTGVHRPDAGEILVDGKRVVFNTPRDSRSVGIEMIYQNLALAQNLDVVANVFLGREVTRTVVPGLVRQLDERRMERETRQLLDRLRINISSVRTNVEQMSGGQQQAIAIARAVAFQARVVIMDEPTASLAVKEVGKVLDLISEPERRRRIGYPDQPSSSGHFHRLRPGDGSSQRRVRCRTSDRRHQYGRNC